MSDRDYEVGYGKPPKAFRFKKLQSGNPAGRRRKPPPTVARFIEQSLLETLPVKIGGIQNLSTGLELIAMGLLVKVSDGNRKALRVFRKYEAFAKTKPRIKKLDLTLSEGGETCRRFFETGVFDWKVAKKKQVKLTLAERKRQAVIARMARMKAGLEEIKILGDMTAKEAMEMYSLTLQQPAHPKRPRIRPRKGGLEASEVFDRVINSPVTVNNDGHAVMTPRILLVIRRLLTKAVRGDVKSADMLITMHADSLKHGDFFPES